MNSISQLRATRRYLTAFLLNIDIKPSEMNVGTLLVLLDDLCEHPDKYKELLRKHDTPTKRNP